MVYAKACSLPDNDTLLWDFDIQTDHQITARRADLTRINKKKERELA